MDIYDAGAYTVVFVVVVAVGYGVYLAVVPFVGTTVSKILLAALGVPIGWGVVMFRRDLSRLVDRVRGTTGT